MARSIIFAQLLRNARAELQNQKSYHHVMFLNNGLGELHSLSCFAPINRLHFTLGVIVLAGTLLSYYPQQRKIVRNHSSAGISHWSLMLGAISSVANVLNVLILQFPVIHCCSMTEVCARIFVNHARKINKGDAL